jgi:hypothetical protein
VPPVSPRRRKAQDYIYVHQFAGGVRAYRKAVRVRTYEAEGWLPLIVLSASDDPTQNVAQDVERIAAEVLLREYPEGARRAKRDEPWFVLVEHLPPSYDLLQPRKEERRETFEYVEFDDYRITVGGRLGLRRRVRDAERALRENTRAEFGISRVTLGHPTWHPTSKQEVERKAGMTLDDVLDAPPGKSFPSNLPRLRGDERG